MVYQDLTPENNSSEKILAPVQDRFLAFAFDAALCFPTLFILLKPLWRKIQYLSLTAIDSTELKVLMILGGLCSVVLFVLFNAFCLYRWGATPGKKIFQIRVVSTSDNSKIGFSQAMMRSCVWAWQLVFLGIPFMEVLSHPDRRPWHDRLSETLVLTNKKVRSDSPHWIEQHFFRNLYWAISCVVAVTAGLQVKSLMVDSMNGEMKREELVREGYLCSSLSESLPPTEDNHRLDYGLGLFLVGQINSECLESELDFVLWSQNQKEIPWAYLARGFLSEAAGNDATAEFERACPDDQETKSVCAITNWKLTGVVTPGLKETWLYRVAHLKELIKLGNFESLKAHINSIRWPDSLLSYVQSKGLQSLWVRGQLAAFEESFPILSAAWDHELRLEIGSWGCLAQLTKHCQDKKEISACESLRNEISQGHGKVWPRPVSLALARESVCRGRQDQETQSQFSRAFLRNPETQWVEELVDMKSFDDRSWKRVLAALKTVPADDWLYAQGLWYLSQGSVTPDRQKNLKDFFADSGSEDLFWWLAKTEYKNREKALGDSVPLRVPSGSPEKEK